MRRWYSAQAASPVSRGTSSTWMNRLGACARSASARRRMLSQQVVSTMPSRLPERTVSNVAFAKLHMFACMQDSAASKLTMLSSGSMRSICAPIASSASAGTYLQTYPILIAYRPSFRRPRPAQCFPR